MSSILSRSFIVRAHRATLSTLYTSPRSSSAGLKTKADKQSQGHVTDPANKHKKDVQHESVRAGKMARSKDNAAVDVASPQKKPKPQETGSGNPEGVGFVDQVGSASTSAQHFEFGNGSKGKGKK